VGILKRDSCSTIQILRDENHLPVRGFKGVLGVCHEWTFALPAAGIRSLGSPRHGVDESADIIAQIDAPLDHGHSDSEIAVILNERGLRVG
jgi:hypothetical protein